MPAQTETRNVATCPSCANKFETENNGRETSCPHCGAPFVPGEPVARAVKSSGIVAALYWCSAGLLLLTIFAVFDRGGAAVLIIGVFGSAALLGIAKLIECANETAQRVVRMEIHLETLANDRK